MGARGLDVALVEEGPAFGRWNDVSTVPSAQWSVPGAPGQPDLTSEAVPYEDSAAEASPTFGPVARV